MRVCNHVLLPNHIGMSILEVDDATAVEKLKNRFLLVLEVNGKKILPKTKKKFYSVNTNHYLYPFKSEISDGFIVVDRQTYLELQLCDRKLEDCTTELMEYLSLSNKGENIMKILKKKFRL